MTTPLPGVIIAAPQSGAGKTTLTLAILRALARRSDPPAPIKVGPDYIDPQFHRLASGRACYALDPWAMKTHQIMDLIAAHGARGQGMGASWVLAEGVMGLFDGARGMGRSGFGSTADLAALTGWPVVLVLDVTGQGATVAAIVRGLRDHRPHVNIAGVILNKVGSSTHVALLKNALEEIAVPVLGSVPKDSMPHLGSRHLGLEQAVELQNAGKMLDQAAESVMHYVDLAALRRLAGHWGCAPVHKMPVTVAPPGRRIALAHDPCFAFVYDHVIEGWEQAGSEIIRFSPLDDEGPDLSSDMIYLPGGYPELHANRLAAAQNFKSTMREAATRNVPIYGECGGYMVLGRGLLDRQGVRHTMLGLLDHETSFQSPKLHLGYRTLDLTDDTVFGRTGTRLFGHEFHYASVSYTGAAQPLGRMHDAVGTDLGLVGGRTGSVFGSFFHLIAT